MHKLVFCIKHPGKNAKCSIPRKNSKKVVIDSVLGEYFRGMKNSKTSEIFSVLLTSGDNAFHLGDTILYKLPSQPLFHLMGPCVYSQT